jgi:hypothetical protein
MRTCIDATKNSGHKAFFEIVLFHSWKHYTQSFSFALGLNKNCAMLTTNTLMEVKQSKDWRRKDITGGDKIVLD